MKSTESSISAMRSAGSASIFSIRVLLSAGMSVSSAKLLIALYQHPSRLPMPRPVSRFVESIQQGSLRRPRPILDRLAQTWSGWPGHHHQLTRSMDDPTVPSNRPSGSTRRVGPFPPPRRVLPGFAEAELTNPKTTRSDGTGLRKRSRDRSGRIYEWDYQHGTVE